MNMRKQLFQNTSGSVQLVFLLLLWGLGFLFAGVLIAVIALSMGITNPEDMYKSIPFLKIAQIVQANVWMLIPAILFAFLFYDKPYSFLKADKYPPLKIIVLTTLLVIVISPFISWVQYLNEHITFPQSLASVEQWMRNKETDTEKFVMAFISDNSVIGIISNLFIIALVAGVTEEFFFRGALQQSIKKIVLNKHAAIWISAIIFSAIHFQFFGFIPRMLLGALLGYLFLWSGNIWVPIYAHTLNNGITVIMLHAFYGTPDFEKMEYLSVNKYPWFALISILLSATCLYLIFKERIKDKISTIQ